MDLALDLLRGTLSQIRAAPRGHLMLGGVYLFELLVVLPLLVVMNVVLALAFVGMGEDHAEYAVPVFFAVLLFSGIVTFTSVLLNILLNGGYTRAAAREAAGGGLVSPGVVWAEARGLGVRIVGAFALVLAITIAGAFLCYLPGIIASFLLWYTLPLVATTSLGPVDAAKTSARAIIGDPGKHVPVVLCGWLATMLFAYLPLVGLGASAVFACVYHARSVRTLFPDLVEAARNAE